MELSNSVWKVYQSVLNYEKMFPEEDSISVLGCSEILRLPPEVVLQDLETLCSFGLLEETTKHFPKSGVDFNHFYHTVTDDSYLLLTAEMFQKTIWQYIKKNMIVEKVLLDKPL